jgi:hypothetical protein
MPLDAAHALGHRVKAAIRERNPRVRSVLVHMEPFLGDDGSTRRAPRDDTARS